MNSKGASESLAVRRGSALSTEIATERIARKQVVGVVERANEGPGIVRQPGRLLADGTRRGARVARRLTLYLPLEVADALEDRARARRVPLSDEAAERLAEAYGVEINGADE